MSGMGTGPVEDARLNLKIDPTIDRDFRIACVLRGNLTLSEAVEQAILLWLAHNNNEAKTHG